MTPQISAFVAKQPTQNANLHQAYGVQQLLNWAGIPVGAVVALQANADQSIDQMATISDLTSYGMDPADMIQYEILKAGQDPTDPAAQSINVGDTVARLSQPNVKLSVELNEVNQAINPGAPPYAFLMNTPDIASAIDSLIASKKSF